jgi:branched-chain amino acid transport system ATP-binding protein
VSRSKKALQTETDARIRIGAPSLRVNRICPLEIPAQAEAIRSLKREGLAVLLSEQNLHFARIVADRATIIEKGRIRYTGTMEDLSRDREIQKEYLSA